MEQSIKTYKVEFYFDIPGLDGRRETEVEASTEEEAREEAADLLFNALTIEDVKIKDE